MRATISQPQHPTTPLVDLPVPISRVSEFFVYPSRKVLDHQIAAGATNGLFLARGVYRAPGRAGPGTGRWMFNPAAYFQWLSGQAGMGR